MCTDHALFTSKNSPKVLYNFVCGFGCERNTGDLFTGGSIIMDYGLVFWPEDTVVS